MKRRKLTRKLNGYATRLGLSVVGNGFVMKRYPRKREKKEAQHDPVG